MIVQFRPTIILLSATAGFGHVKAGKSLAAALSERFPEWDIIHENIGDFSDPILRASTEKGWLFVSTTPVFRSIYSFLHRRVLSNDKLCRLIAPIFYGIGRNLSDLYGERDVRAVIALHPAALAAAIGWKREKKFLLATVATDLIVHGLQSLPGVDLVFADRGSIFASKAARDLLSSGAVVFSGLPVERKFFQSTCRRNINADTILVSFGALGLRGARNINKLISIISHREDFNFTIICGNNSYLRQKTLRAMSGAGLLNRVSVLGFVDDMEDRLANAVLFLGKPGGISVGEVLASDIPIGIIDFLPGQEEANIEALQLMGRSVTLENVDRFGIDRSLPLPESDILRLRRRRSVPAGGIDAIVCHLSRVLAEPNWNSKAG